MSPSGSMALYGDWVREELKLWELTTGGLLRVLTGHRVPVDKIIFLPRAALIRNGQVFLEDHGNVFQTMARGRRNFGHRTAYLSKHRDRCAAEIMEAAQWVPTRNHLTFAAQALVATPHVTTVSFFDTVGFCKLK